jgi:hypothetical protein
MGAGGQHHATSALPLGLTYYSLYRRLGGPCGQSGQVWKTAPSGIDPRTVQPTASCYANYAILVHPHHIPQYHNLKKKHSLQ